MRYTPGPWTYELDDEFGTAEVFVDDDMPGRALIACVDSQPEYEGNTYLIAAAPDLLAACQEFVRKCECGEARSTRSYRQMKTAIAKAGGL